MKTEIKEKIILNNIVKNFTIYDIIIMKIFKNYTLKVYQIGYRDAFNFENKKNEAKKSKEVARL